MDTTEIKNILYAVLGLSETCRISRLEDIEECVGDPGEVVAFFDADERTENAVRDYQKHLKDVGDSLSADDFEDLTGCPIPVTPGIRYAVQQQQQREDDEYASEYPLISSVPEENVICSIDSSGDLGPLRS